MNIPARIAFLEDQLARCEAALIDSEPGTSLYQTALDCWMSLSYRIQDMEEDTEKAKTPQFVKVPATTAVSLDSDQPSGTLEPGGNESVEQEPPALVSTPEPAPTPAPAPDADLPTKQEVRTRLATLSAKYEQLNVAKIMEGMGFTRLSDIPAERYPELLRQVDEAVKELA